MVSLNFNAANVKPNAGFEPLPTGIYPVIITNSELKPNKAGTGSYIQLDMTVQGGEHNGKRVTDRLNINNPNQQAVDIAYATLSAICHVTGRLNIQDTQQLHGVPFRVMVAKVRRDDKPDDENAYSNEVKGYKDINGNDPGFSGQSHPGSNQAPQQQQPPQPQNGGQQPWNGNAQGGQPHQPQQQPQQGQPWNNGQQGQPQQQQPQNQPQQSAPPQNDETPPWVPKT